MIPDLMQLKAQWHPINTSLRNRQNQDAMASITFIVAHALVKSLKVSTTTIHIVYSSWSIAFEGESRIIKNIKVQETPTYLLPRDLLSIAGQSWYSYLLKTRWNQVPLILVYKGEQSCQPQSKAVEKVQNEENNSIDHHQELSVRTSTLS